jgi:hypothetical protein
MKKYLFLSLIATEELNNDMKQQIGRSNNHFNTINSCIKHFARNNLIIDFEEQQRVLKKRNKEYRDKIKGKTSEILKNKENCINI